MNDLKLPKIHRISLHFDGHFSRLAGFSEAKDDGSGGDNGSC